MTCLKEYLNSSIGKVVWHVLCISQNTRAIGGDGWCLTEIGTDYKRDLFISVVY